MRLPLSFAIEAGCFAATVPFNEPQWRPGPVNLASIADEIAVTWPDGSRKTWPGRFSPGPRRRCDPLAHSAGRWGRPTHLQGVALFLASEASDYVNGAMLVVDGGGLGRWG